MAVLVHSKVLFDRLERYMGVWVTSGPVPVFNNYNPSISDNNYDNDHYCTLLSLISIITLCSQSPTSYFHHIRFKGNGPKDELEEMEQLNLLSITFQLSHIVRRDQASCGVVVEQAINAHAWLASPKNLKKAQKMFWKYWEISSSNPLL